MPRQKFAVETQECPERAVLVGIDRGSGAWPVEESLDELERLVDTAGAITVCRMSQRLESPNPRTFIGQGKAEELALAVRAQEADLVVFDDELTPSQQNNLEKLLGKPIKVIDRTALILDIFALHATSREGRLQVKLAQNQYLYPRLRGMWSHLAAHRMGGGVGSRFGEGESQLEVDRRLVRKRIAHIRSELKDLASSRGTQRKQRNQSGVFRIALAGYTNAGKSSLMNGIADAGVFACDKLFATLDSTTRQIELPSGLSATITDTVGFIQKLPHTLVDAFRSTLDEVAEADLICLVLDASSPQRDAQLAAVRDTLGQIGAAQTPTLVVLNKIDLVEVGERERLQALFGDAVLVSARTGEGTDTLLLNIEERILETQRLIEALIPYREGKLVELAHRQCIVLEEAYEESGTRMRLRVPLSLASRFEMYAQ